MLAPNGSEYSRINDYSIVINIYMKTFFLFVGDAEKFLKRDFRK